MAFVAIPRVCSAITPDGLWTLSYIARGDRGPLALRDPSGAHDGRGRTWTDGDGRTVTARHGPHGSVGCAHCAHTTARRPPARRPPARRHVPMSSNSEELTPLFLRRVQSYSTILFNKKTQFWANLPIFLAKSSNNFEPSEGTDESALLSWSS